jgi:Mg-chelatase subunit ChlD
LKVEEAKRSMMFIWDESGSIGSAEESIYQAINHMADDISPLVESVNLMTLGDGDVQPLMREWSSNPLEIKAALAAFDRSGSSNAESTLISAMKRLADRQGNRVIVLVTDAESGGGTLNSELWQQFRKVQPRVFTFEVQAESRAELAAAYQDKMQDWAAANHGDYRSFQTQADLDHAYERAACLMRRPAEYQVSWNPAPGAGRLSVAWEKGKAMSGATIELILDASGSMRSSRHKVDGRLKIDVAKEVMKQIIDRFPDDTQVGLRVYGHRRKDGSKGACEDSELITPIGPLDRKRLSDQIQSIKALGGTPIAYSLQQAGNDLARIQGPRHIVLITDGKEECKGDPVKAVEQIRDKGVDVRLDIVGFALVDKKDKEDMIRVAASSGGRFFDAQNRDALSQAIDEALAMPFEVVDGRENKVGDGLTGQGANALYQGAYTVVVHTAKGDVTVRDVPVTEGRTTRVILSREGERIGYRVESGEDGGKP